MLSQATGAKKQTRKERAWNILKSYTMSQPSGSEGFSAAYSSKGFSVSFSTGTTCFTGEPWLAAHGPVQIPSPPTIRRARAALISKSKAWAEHFTSHVWQVSANATWLKRTIWEHVNAFLGGMVTQQSPPGKTLLAKWLPYGGLKQNIIWAQVNINQHQWMP